MKRFALNLRVEVAYSHTLSLVLPISYRDIDHESYVRGRQWAQKPLSPSE